MRFPRRDRHTLTGVYALGVVDEAERNRFERHLNRCPPCTDEVRGLREVTARLAMAASVPTPPQLRERVLAAARATSQLPAVAAPPERGTARSAWRLRLAAGAAVVGVAAAVALGVVQVNTQHELSQAQQRNRALAAVLAAPDVRVLSAATSVGGAGTVVVSPSRRQMIFVAAGLPALPAAKAYQLWLIGPPGIRSAGLLPPPQAGRTAPVLASGLTAGDKVGVTVEPAGGSAQPTTTPILLIPLPA